MSYASNHLGQKPEPKLRIYNVGPGWNPVSFTDLAGALDEAREHLENSEAGDMVKIEITEMTQPP